MNHRLLIAALALIGIVFAAQLTAGQLASGEACPSLGPVPACYLVFGAYLLIFVSSMLTGWLRQILFLLSWFPVFGLALVASAFDLVAGPVCPRIFGGVPQCLVSLALAAAIGALWILGLRAGRRSRPIRGGAR